MENAFNDVDVRKTASRKEKKTFPFNLDDLINVIASLFLDFFLL